MNLVFVDFEVGRETRKGKMGGEIRGGGKVNLASVDFEVDFCTRRRQIRTIMSNN